MTLMRSVSFSQAFLAALLLLSVNSAHSGDLGSFDRVPGIFRGDGRKMKASNMSKRKFEAYGAILTFSGDRLTFELTNDRSDINYKKYPGAKFNGKSEQGSISPDQVISLNRYYVGPAMMSQFDIWYVAMNGDRSMASIIFGNANTALEFHRVFVKWWNKRLDSAGPLVAD